MYALRIEICERLPYLRRKVLPELGSCLVCASISSIPEGNTKGSSVADYEPLQPRLDTLVEKYTEDAAAAEKLEIRVAALIQQYATQVGSELLPF